MIRWLFRTLGTVAFLAAAAMFGNELQLAASGGYRLVPLGELWAWLNANSLIGLQAAIEAASPWLWRAIVLPILMGPAWAFPLGLGLVLRIIGGSARRRLTPAYARQIGRLTTALRQHAMARRPGIAGTTPRDAVTPEPTPEAPPPSTPRGASSPRREPTIVRRS